MGENKAKFIVVEGIDGSGKGTQIKRLLENLNMMEDSGVIALYDREPTNSEIGKLIRNALKGDCQYSIRTMALLFAADRQEHCKNIRKKLDNGLTVVCDRYVDSNYAYQGSELGNIFINVCNEGIIKPDLTIFLDVDPTVAMGRITGRGNKTEIYENVEKLEQTRKAYLNLYASAGEEVAIIPVTTVDETADRVWERVKKLFE